LLGGGKWVPDGKGEVTFCLGVCRNKKSTTGEIGNVGESKKNALGTLAVCSVP